MRSRIAAIATLLVALPALAVDPGRLALARSKTDRGNALLAKQSYEKAEKLFRGAIDDEPAYPAAYLGLGAALCGLQRWGEAAPVLEQAKQRYIAWEQQDRMTNLEARQDAENRAREFRDLQHQQALKAQPGGGKTAAELMTASASTRVSTEEYLARRGWQPEAFEAVPAQVFYLSGLCHLHSGNRGAAIEELWACVDRDPHHGLGHYNLAVALFTQGDVATAWEQLTAAEAAGIKPNPQFRADLEKAATALGGRRP